MPRKNGGTPPIFLLISSIVSIILLVSVVAYINMPEEIDESFQDSSQEVLDPCKDPTPKEDCSFVSTSIGEFRYRIIRGTGDVAAVVDVGGPGSSILSGDVNLNDLTSSLSLPEDYSVIFIEEPWVRKPTSDECKSGLSNFYMNSRDPGGPNKEEADNLVEACEIRAGGGNWGFSSNTYSEVVAAIEESESVSVNGFLGYSFGSARLSYLENWEFDWVSLIRPFPVGASGTKLMESRSNQVGNIYEKIKPIQKRRSSRRMLPAGQSKWMSLTIYQPRLP